MKVHIEFGDLGIQEGVTLEEGVDRENLLRFIARQSHQLHVHEVNECDVRKS